ncbi:guided entry of tail-anchored proteins factor CAMLG-like isoform X3 [Montipora foliosa]|uniref:guided entry of tail-anchored proteins factor CAMLG-like isoform X3 n=1 Tax=Montipora foliosa TaxID=591990 RepID=UPI0035F1C389
MASADRREARRRKLLQNSELRLGRILGSRSSHPTAPHEPEKTLVKSIDLEKRGDEGQSNEVPVERGFLSDKSELPSEYQSVKSGFTTGSEESTEPITEAMKEKRNSLESKLDYLTEDSTTRGTNLLSSPGEDQTAASSQQSPASSQKYLIYSESMMWPFLALQLLFACLTSMQQTSQSPFISMLTVALQLCGIPIQFTHKINFALTAILAALKDFVAFLFSVIIFHHIVDYLMNSGLIKQVYDV